MTDAEKVDFLVDALTVIGMRCFTKYCDNDSDNFLYDTYQYIQDKLNWIYGDGKHGKK